VEKRSETIRRSWKGQDPLSYISTGPDIRIANERPDWVGVQCTRLSPKRMLALHSKWDAIALRDRGGVETPALLLIIPLALHEWIS